METREKLGIVATVCVFAGCLAASAAAKIIYVEDDAAGANNGSSWTNAFQSLQEALITGSPARPSRRGESQNAVVSWETEIRVAQGVYMPYEVGSRSVASVEAFGLGSGLTVKGGYAGVGAADPNERDVETYRTILSGDLNDDDVDIVRPRDLLSEPTRGENSRHIVRCYGSDANTILDGFVITGATDGALENFGGRLSVRDCLFTRNATTLDGGAVHSQQGSTVLTRCRFVGNWAARFGGAVCADLRGTLTLMDCRFIENEACNGGAAASEGIDVQMAGCTFEGNVGEGQGAVHCMGGTLRMDRCTFLGNSSPLSPAGRGDGGAVGLFGTNDAALTGCRFEKNSAYAGGAVWSDGSVVSLTGGTFEQNTAPRGGAVYYQQSSLVATNCRFAGNVADGDGGAISSEGGVMILERCALSGNLAWFGGAVHLSQGSSPKTDPQAYDATMTHCVFSGNRSPWGGTLSSDHVELMLINCTFANNQTAPGTGGASLAWWFGRPGDATYRLTVHDCILRDGARPIYSMPPARGTSTGGEAQVVVEYTDVQGGWPGEGNFDADPCFARPGYWFDSANPSVLVGPFHQRATWADGDYHLKSQAGRWDAASETWVLDGATSPCIDAGDPESPSGDEPLPDGGRINMGAYGGTTEASKSPVR